MPYSWYGHDFRSLDLIPLDAYLSKRVVIPYAVWFPVSKRGQGEWVTAPQLAVVPSFTTRGAARKGRHTSPSAHWHPSEASLGLAVPDHHKLPSHVPWQLSVVCVHMQKAQLGNLTDRDDGERQESSFLLGVVCRGTRGNPAEIIRLKSHNSVTLPTPKE